MKAEVTVKIQIKDVTIELSLDEAAELAETLRRLTAERVVSIPTPWVYPSWPVQPWTVETSTTGDYYTISYEPEGVAV